MKPKPARRIIIRAVSIDADLALWLEQQAAGEKRSASNYVNSLLKRLRTVTSRPPGAPAIRRRRAVPRVTNLAILFARLQTQSAQPRYAMPGMRTLPSPSRDRA